MVIAFCYDEIHLSVRMTFTLNNTAFDSLIMLIMIPFPSLRVFTVNTHGETNIILVETIDVSVDNRTHLVILPFIMGNSHMMFIFV